MERAKVVKVNSTGNVAADVETLVGELGGIGEFVRPGESVLVKPSCNSPDPFPAVTDPQVIRATVRLVQRQTDAVTIGDSSGVLYKPTAQVFDAMGLPQMAEEMGVELVDFDERKWVKKKNRRARRLRSLRVTEELDHYDRLIFLPTMRTHRGPRFTMSLKLGMGLLKVRDRLKMHARGLEEKVAAMNLYFKPDLIVMDGRKTFITDGPEHGDEREPGVMFASTDRVAIDMEGLKVLKSYDAEKLDMPVEEVPVIKTALELGVV
ncbi:MAG: DUF362 domain-containing protein [Phycisphaerae bacterium]